MKIFFLCLTGHHTSLLAAGLYLDMLKAGRDLRHAVKNLRGWDDINLKEVGVPFYVGKDKENNEVYTIGINIDSSMMERVVNEVLNLIGINPRERRIINVSGAVTGWTKVGLAAKKMHFNILAKLLFYIGLKHEQERVLQVLRKNGITTC